MRLSLPLTPIPKYKPVLWGRPATTCRNSLLFFGFPFRSGRDAQQKRTVSRQWLPSPRREQACHSLLLVLCVCVSCVLYFVSVFVSSGGRGGVWHTPKRKPTLFSRPSTHDTSRGLGGHGRLNRTMCDENGKPTRGVDLATCAVNDSFRVNPTRSVSTQGVVSGYLGIVAAELRPCRTRSGEQRNHASSKWVRECVREEGSE